MKFFAVLLVVLLAAGLSPARAQQSADDQYLIIYSLIQQADTLAGAGELRQALAQYNDVQGELEKFQNGFPDWNPKIINFRLKYVAGKIVEIEAQLPAPAPAPTNSTANVPPQMAAVTNAAPAASTTSTADSDAELANLRGQLRELQADNASLTAKLKEALAAQPAAVDPRELAKAQEQIQSLMKENDLLKADLSQVKSETNNAEATAELVKAQEQVRSLTKENDLLKADMAQEHTNTTLDTSALMEVQAALAEANKKLADQTARADKLASDNEALQTRVQSLLASPGAMEALHDENAMLKNQLADLQSSSTTNLPEVDRLNSDLKKARLEIAALQSDTQVKQLEKAALENRIEKLNADAVKAQASVPGQEENEARIRELTQERNDLLAKLGEANKELYGSKKQNAAAQINELTDEIKTLRARLAVDEAQAVPYTQEELALFKQAPPQLADPDAEKKSINELPAGSAELIAEAQTYFSAKQYDKAEEDYRKILQRNENNSLVLANLAAIEMEQGKLDDAEKHIKAAIAQNPDDAYNLLTLGTLKFRQEKYDDALDALSRAAKLDPQNPQIENYLGITLSHKGLRVQAETMLRKAIQLDPNYAEAHNNLAAIYISEQPPLVQLARWHYQKALDAGMPHNPYLEKAMDEAGALPSPQ